MCGKILPFGDSVATKKDSVYDCLIEPSVFDNECEAFLSVVLSALCQYVTRKFAEFLPGGKFVNPSLELKESVKSVEKHKKFSERIFAYYDNLLKFKPHITTLASEAYVSFTINKTMEWLSSISAEEAGKLVAEARKSVTQLRKTFKMRRDIITARRREKLFEQQQALERANAKRLQEQELITLDMLLWSLANHRTG